MDSIDLKVADKDIRGRFNWEEVLQKNSAAVSLGLAGLILLLVGLFWVTSLTKSQDKIEIIPSVETDKKIQPNIFADIEGSVIKPGVYELPAGSRVEDLLIAAGGLSVKADRDWVEKTLNRAQKLIDGIKIYIPSKSERVKEQENKKEIAGSGFQNVAGVQATDKVNINTASQSELEALWGIGPVTAKKIIDSRPYQSIEELLSKKIIFKNVFEKIKEQISVY